MTSRARVLLAAVILALPAVPAVGVGAGSRSGVRVRADLERAIVAHVNAVRLRHGARPLRPASSLAAAARSHSLDMAREGFFAHQSPGGSPFWRRIERLYRSQGYRRWSVGENIVWRSPDLSPAQAVRLWLESRPHRRVLLDPRWSEVGLAAVHAPAAPGVFSGLPVTIVTADFGVRVR